MSKTKSVTGNNSFSGFTLLEILIVLALISIVISVVALKVSGRKDNGSSALATMNLLRNRMTFAQQQALLLDKTLGLALSSTAYQFMEYLDVPNNPHWQRSTERSLAANSWPAKFTLKLAFNGAAPNSLAPTLPKIPQIIFLPNGELTLFQLYINRRFVLASNDASELNLARS